MADRRDYSVDDLIWKNTVGLEWNLHDKLICITLTLGYPNPRSFRRQSSSTAAAAGSTQLIKDKFNNDVVGEDS
jgi:hypothetical protein